MENYIQNLIIMNNKQRYELELQYVESDVEKTEINKILAKYNKITEKKIDIFDNKIDELEILSMKKLFYRLKPQQKSNRIKQYFKDTYNLSDDDAQKNTDNILELLTTNMLKSKDILYDTDTVKITNIENVEWDETMKIMKLNKKQKVVKKNKIVEK